MLKIGTRVQLHSATDRWMRGDRYGDVIKIGRKYNHVLMDRSGQTIKIRPENLIEVDMTPPWWAMQEDQAL